MFVCWWCLSFMNELQYVFCWILLIILCIFVINFLWFSPCLSHGCIPYCSPDLQPRNIAETLKPSLLYWFLFEIVLACFFSLRNNLWHKQEVPGQLPGKLSLGLRAILIWLWDVFSHDQIWVHGHSDVIEGCVPTWSNIRVVSILWENGGTWSVTRNPQSRTECPFDMVRGLSSFHGEM